MKKRRMFWQIADKIVSLIKTGIYAPGSRLPPERELAELFNVSRPTIREAVIALEAQGYVEVKTSSGVYVLNTQPCETSTPVNNITAFELTQARALVEGEAAALAASSITNEELQALKDSLETMASGIDADNADREFHEIISNATRNRAILIAVRTFWDLRDSQKQIQEAYTSVCSQSDSHRLEEHYAIYNGLASRDPQAARAAMHEHFNRLINALFEVSEAKALEEMRKKTNQTRDLYSLNHLVGKH